MYVDKTQYIIKIKPMALNLFDLWDSISKSPKQICIAEICLLSIIQPHLSFLSLSPDLCNFMSWATTFFCYVKECKPSTQTSTLLDH